MRGKQTRARARRVLACALALLLVAGLVPALPEVPRALAEEVDAIALGDGAEDEVGVELSDPELADDVAEGAVELGDAGTAEADGDGTAVVLDEAAEDALLDQLELVAQQELASDGEDAPQGEPEADGESALEVQSVSVSNPRVVKDSSMTSGQVTTWDCVWFGSYPQTEVAPGDSAYASLQSASWDANGDATVGGRRYRRISKSDVTYDYYWSDDGYGSATYRYFRYEPIKWRVLKASGGKALVVSDVALDDQRYNANSTNVTWETSSVRSWLNGYGASTNQPGTDFTRKNFVGTAFSASERSAILTTDVVNASNTEYGTAGGNNTKDKVFLLSEAEVYDASHGFANSYGTYDEARRCKPTDYARAMGAYKYTGGSYNGNCYWWLRSPGYGAYHAAYVFGDGDVGCYGDVGNDGAVRPALNLNLASSHPQAAGTVSSNGDVREPVNKTISSVSLEKANYTYDGTAKKPDVTVRAGDETVPALGYSVTYENNVNVGTATVTVTGKGDYTGTKSATFAITAKPISSCAVSLSPTSYTYDGKAKTPEVTVRDGSKALSEGTDYTVKYEGNVNVGTAKATVTGKGNYTGTKVATFTIAQAEPTLKFASATVTKKTTDAPFTNPLTKTTDGTVTFSSSNTKVATVGKAGKVTIKGGGRTTISASAAAGKNYKAGSASFTLNVTKPVTYVISYDANGGTGTPSTQTKNKDVELRLSTAKPKRAYLLKYNANGGSVSPASKSVSCGFVSWNTKKDGSGKSYSPGGSYTANAGATLYAQWKNGKAGALATPKRAGHDFAGWFTKAKGGTKVTASTVVTSNMTVYAHWTDPYNLGDETYSFENYGDWDSPGGHCFGMSSTSAGYHNGLLDIAKAGGSASKSLYSLDRTTAVMRPICYYQGIQGSYSTRSTVAGGSYYLGRGYDIASDWQSVVNYVRNHSYDNTGMLQIGFRKDGQGGHAINFLRYDNVSGQDRIYAYDNNFPDRETYFYKDGYGRVMQAPVQTFSGSIDCIALRNVRTYFSSVKSFDATHVIYVAKDAATVHGFSYTYMEGGVGGSEYVMYEIPADRDKVTIIPKEDYADFLYMGTEYSFGEVTGETRGELRFATHDEGAGGSDASFAIYEAGPQTVTAANKAVGVGKTASLGAKTSGDGKLTYKSSDTSVATVSAKGVVSGKKVGTAKITITAAATSKCAKATKTVTVTVKKTNTMTAKVAKGTVTASLKALKGKAVKLAANVTVSKAKGAVSYANASSDATARKFKVDAATGALTVPKGTKKGAYQVKVKVTAKGNKAYLKGTKTVTYKVQVK